MELDVEERSDSLAENSTLAEAHDNCARDGETDSNTTVNHHFICYVNYGGKLLELGQLFVLKEKNRKKSYFSKYLWLKYIYYYSLQIYRFCCSISSYLWLDQWWNIPKRCWKFMQDTNERTGKYIVQRTCYRPCFSIMASIIWSRLLYELTVACFSLLIYNFSFLHISLSVALWTDCVAFWIILLIFRCCQQLINSFVAKYWLI